MTKDKWIFNQRLNILKEENINEILKDFFNEILINLNLVREDFQKSGDEKSYLTEIKNITGNAVNDKEILEFGKLNKPEFTKKIHNLFSEKKNSRIKILGENQNNSLEKKNIFTNYRFFMEITSAILRTA